MQISVDVNQTCIDVPYQVSQLSSYLSVGIRPTGHRIMLAEARVDRLLGDHVPMFVHKLGLIKPRKHSSV